MMILKISKFILLLKKKLRYCTFNIFGSLFRVTIGKNVVFNTKVKFNGLGNVQINENVILGFYLASSTKREILIQARNNDSVIRIGKNSVIGNGNEIIATSLITIGETCLFGPRVIIYDSDFHGIKPDERNLPKISPVNIGSNVWIGTEAMILKGVHIGNDSVIGARCLVNKDIPDGSIVVGNPMKIIGTVYTK